MSSARKSKMVDLQERWKYLHGANLWRKAACSYLSREKGSFLLERKSDNRKLQYSGLCQDNNTDITDDNDNDDDHENNDNDNQNCSDDETDNYINVTDGSRRCQLHWRRTESKLSPSSKSNLVELQK